MRKRDRRQAAGRGAARAVERPRHAHHERQGAAANPVRRAALRALRAHRQVIVTIEVVSRDAADNAAAIAKEMVESSATDVIMGVGNPYFDEQGNPAWHMRGFIYLNAKLFQRFKTLHDHQASLNLNPEQAKLLDVYYKQFVHAGVDEDLVTRIGALRHGRGVVDLLTACPDGDLPTIRPLDRSASTAAAVMGRC
mgnify:CR=1 FL=1